MMNRCFTPIALAVLLSSAMGFTSSSTLLMGRTAISGYDCPTILSSTVASTPATDEDKAAGVPPATSEASANIEDAEIPTNLPSDCGMDYIPLATMLATGQLAEADQVCQTTKYENWLVCGRW
jgi:hypothetical protein